jgi:hypothetical protein
MVDDEWLMLVEEEVREIPVCHHFSYAAIFPVSAVSGEGILNCCRKYRN